jgi:hypothetical protein
MGGSKAPTAAIAAALLAFLLALPASAAAGSPLDAASAGLPAAQQAASLAQDTASAAVPAAIRETVERATPKAPETRTSAPGKSDAPADAPAPAHAATRTAAPPGPQVASAPVGPERGSGDGMRRHAVKTPSPPHGRKAMPPARSASERAGAARSPRVTATARVFDDAPGDAGTANGTHGLAAPGAFFIAVLLILACALARPFCLRPLRLAAPGSRRLAFVSPGVPPG